MMNATKKKLRKKKYDDEADDDLPLRKRFLATTPGSGSWEANSCMRSSTVLTWRWRTVTNSMRSDSNNANSSSFVFRNGRLSATGGEGFFVVVVALFLASFLPLDLDPPPTFPEVSH